MDFRHVMDQAVRAFESAGVLILIVGSVFALIRYLFELARHTPTITAFQDLRANLGRGILLGLEILVVADIIRTIVVSPTLESAATLGLIVLVRILLSFAIDIEVDGVAPWRKLEVEERRDPVDPPP
jgi:uncharacterized membrane protein